MSSADQALAARTQRAIRACYMRGGTSKGVFFLAEDLPQDPVLRDRLLLRVIGSPDPYAKHIDGMGGSTSSTSKVVLVSASSRADCDVDYLFGQVAVREPVIDWSGNCGNLTAAVGPFAIHRQLVQAGERSVAIVRIWQANIGKRIIAHVPVRGSRVVEDGDFGLDGVTFPSAEVRLEFMDPAGSEHEALFPSGNALELLDVPGVGRIEATLISAGNPTVVVDAAALGLIGNEMPPDFNQDLSLLERCERIRAQGAVRMGLTRTAQEATDARPATPKLAFVSAPRGYRSSSGKDLRENDMDLTVRILSMGVMHHAVTGTGAIALAVASVVHGTVVHRAILAAARPQRPLDPQAIRLGHPSGTLTVGAEAALHGSEWTIANAVVSRSARRLMDGHVFVPSRSWSASPAATSNSSTPDLTLTSL
jgi:probable AcnD-accessory protein PrpF